MTTILNFKDLVDLMKWRPLSPFNTFSSTNSILKSDLRNNEDRHPLIYFTISTSILSWYNVKNDDFGFNAFPINPSLASAVTDTVFMPQKGPSGVLAAGSTTTNIVISTVFPAAVGVNQLANRVDGRGFKIRIIGNAAGSSGKIEERLIVANTSGTTPTITLDSPLSFSPIAGDAYELLSGRLFMLGGTNAAGAWKYYDVATNSVSGNLSVVNLPASWTDANLIGLAELHVPYDRSPGEGYFGNLVATGSAGTTLTGQAVGGDAGVVLNQYRNFQIRIVQDTAIPTAVGQRRNITSHTAGPSPVYTVPVWTVTPSATATYVIENNGDRILLWTTTDSGTRTYSISGDSWDNNVTFSARPTTPGTGLMTQHAFAIEPDTASPPNARQSFIFSFRGGVTNTLDLFDIAGAATGLWTGAITYNFPAATFTVGFASTYDPATMQGKYMYICTNPGSSRFQRFDLQNRVMEFVPFLKQVPVSGTFTANKSLAYTVFVDGKTKLSFIIFFSNFNSATNPIFGLPITR